jgi:hypothetical protein
MCCVVVCDLETSRIGAPYIYDISNLRVNQGLDWPWISFPRNFWLQLACAQRETSLRVFWSKKRPQTSKLYITINISNTGCDPMNILVEPSLAKAVRLPIWNPINEMFLFQNLPLRSLGVLRIRTLPPG